MTSLERRLSISSLRSESSYTGSLVLSTRDDSTINYEAITVQGLNEPSSAAQLEDRLFTGEASELVHGTLWSNDKRFGEIRCKAYEIVMNIYVRVIAVLLSLSGIILGVISLKIGIENAIEAVRVQNLRERDTDKSSATNGTSLNLAEATIAKLTNAVPLITEVMTAIFGNPNLPTIYTLTQIIAAFFLVEVVLRWFSFGRIYFRYYRQDAIVTVPVLIIFFSGAILKYFERVSCILLFSLIFIHSLTIALPLALRHLASRGRSRFIRDGYDLDLTYITPQVIAMSFPSSGLHEFTMDNTRLDGDLALRNPISEVSEFLKNRHGGLDFEAHFRVYKLNVERSYDTEPFFNEVHPYDVNDHSVPKLEQLLHYCRHAEEWLASDEHNVIAVHCRAGKGRTRTFCCSYLVYSRVCVSASQAIELFNHRRIKVKNGGDFPIVLIPSQRRYISYVETHLKRACASSLLPWQLPLLPQQRSVTSVHVSGLDDHVTQLVMEIVQDGHVVFQTLPGQLGSSMTSLGSHVVVSGDVMFRFQAPTLERGWEDCAFFFHLHTSFIEDDKFEGRREDIENAYRWKNRNLYGEEFSVVVKFDVTS